MRLIPPGNVGKLSLSGGNYTTNADGTVSTTDLTTMNALLTAGWIPAPSDLMGTGSPEGVTSAPVGVEYAETDGSGDTVRWVKATGTGNTGWIKRGAIQIYTATKTLSNDGTGANGAIIGTTSGSLGHSSGVELVAAVSGKTIVPLAIQVAVTFAVAAYTGGGNVTASIGTTALTTAITKENSFQLGASGTAFAAGAAVAANGLSGAALALKAASAFTDPGAAAGTATVTVQYILV